MRNSIPTAALSEFVNEVANDPEEGLMSYGIEIDWESGTRARTSTKPMLVGPHKRWSMWFNSMQREEPYQGLT